MDDIFIFHLYEGKQQLPHHFLLLFDQWFLAYLLLEGHI